MTARIELGARPFPYTCHAVKKPLQPFWTFLCGLIAIPALLALANNLPNDRGWAKVTLYSLVILGLCSIALLPSRAGIRHMLPNRVLVVGGSTWITAKVFPVEFILMAVAGAATVAFGVSNTYFDGFYSTSRIGTIGFMLGPVAMALGSLLIMHVLWQQLRGIRMTPESITYWRGIGTITLRWEELGDAAPTNDVRDHEGYRRFLDHYVPGAKILTPVERVLGVKLMVHWEDVDTPRLLLETDHFTVEPSALLTAILALRDNPELRPLLSTREAKVLFRGPSWRVRRHMYRTQQWWPRGAAPDGIAVDSSGVVKEFQ